MWIAFSGLALNAVWFLYAMWNTRMLRQRVDRMERMAFWIVKQYDSTKKKADFDAFCE
jgi:hypothetical protein